MAETDNTEKTEEPTQKRLDEALKRGDVVKSQEVNTWFIIAGATLVLMAFSGSMSGGLTTTMRGLLANAHTINMDGPALPRLFQKIGIEVIAAVAIPFLLLMLAALGGNLVQHKLILVDRESGAQTVQNIAGRRVQAAVLHAGARQLRQRHHQAGADRLGAHRADVARARPHHGARALRSGGGAATRAIAGAQTDGRRGRHDGGGGDRRLPVPIPAVAREAEDVAAGI